MNVNFFITFVLCLRLDSGTFVYDAYTVKFVVFLTSILLKQVAFYFYFIFC